MRQEAHCRSRRVDCGGDAPIVFARNGDRFGIVVVDEQADYFFVFVAVESASAENEVSTGAKSVPHVGNDLPAELAALAYERLRPLRNGLAVFAEHTFAAARHVGSDDVEEVAQRADAFGRVVGHNTTVGAPFDDVLAHNESA